MSKGGFANLATQWLSIYAQNILAIYKRTYLKHTGLRVIRYYYW